MFEVEYGALIGETLDASVRDHLNKITTCLVVKMAFKSNLSLSIWTRTLVDLLV